MSGKPLTAYVIGSVSFASAFSLASLCKAMDLSDLMLTFSSNPIRSTSELI